MQVSAYRRSNRRFVIGSTLFVCAFAAGCGKSSESERAESSREAAQPSTAQSNTPSLAPKMEPSDEVVATVDGREIFASELAKEAALTGGDRDRALELLVERELLVGEALRRGLANDVSVADARKAPMARALIKQAFLSEFNGPEDVPLDEVKRAYEKYKLSFVRSEGRFVVYARVPTKGDYAMDVASAEAAAASLSINLPTQDDANCSQFRKTVERYREQHKAVQLAEHPANNSKDPALRETTEKTFGDLMWGLKAPGRVSPPTQTPWGFDMLCLLKIDPPKNVSLADATKEIQGHLFEGSQRYAFRKFSAEVARSLKVRVFDFERAVALAFGNSEGGAQ